MQGKSVLIPTKAIGLPQNPYKKDSELIASIHGTMGVFRGLVTDNVGMLVVSADIATSLSQRRNEEPRFIELSIQIASMLDRAQRLNRFGLALPAATFRGNGLEAVRRLIQIPKGAVPVFSPCRHSGVWHLMAPAWDVLWPRCWKSRNQLNCLVSEEGAAISILVRNFRKSGIKMIPDFMDVVEWNANEGNCFLETIGKEDTISSGGSSKDCAQSLASAKPSVLVPKTEDSSGEFHLLIYLRLKYLLRAKIEPKLLTVANRPCATVF
ncbi:hypothetical protein H4582DRAFT_2057539 [Lactarius indigo]|nr:hypothetical protein H4582DRAFT_2057539 [Lactarius indigo]